MIEQKPKEEIEKRFKNVSKSKTFENILNIFDLQNKSVLDIGCSYGEFLVHFGEGSVGLTIAKEEAAYGKTRKLDIREGNIENLSVPVNEKFDVVFANNIFEHLYSPHQFLVNARSFLNPGGMLILGVPCFPKIAPLFLMYFKKFRGSLAVSHINFFTKETLVETVSRGGWQISEARSFHSKNKIADTFLNFIAPHIYVIATPDPDFAYSEKRMKELAGYGITS